MIKQDCIQLFNDEPDKDGNYFSYVYRDGNFKFMIKYSDKKEYEKEKEIARVRSLIEKGV